ncbi:MAG TPA: hypothetical protein VMW83_00310 [Spirochaetia bacterium]|nr:hypothetical protein [Spirochaetia bacterium]
MASNLTLPATAGVTLSNNDSGTHTAPLTVTISDSSLWQDVYYSTAGDPKQVSGVIYASPLPFNFSLSASATVYAGVR